MDSNPLFDSVLAAAALAGTILLLGAAFLLVLRTPKVQYSLRFLVLSIACVAAVIGLWTALLRGMAGPGLTGPGIDIETVAPAKDRDNPVNPLTDQESVSPEAYPMIEPEADAHTERLQYLRASADGFVPESTIQFRNERDSKRLVVSRTDRGAERLDIVARFEPDGRMVDAVVTTQRGFDRQSASAIKQRDTVRVTRADGSVLQLDCPDSVIITSAPDWTDAVLLVKRYDHQQGGRQEYSGLWIHPVQEPLSLRLTIERVGNDVVQQKGTEVRLDRYLIVLRGGSRYVAWGDAQAQLVRLMSEGRPASGIVLAGWETSAWSICQP
jgi:hypothetical protein